MRISDWSSDVCSSDLRLGAGAGSDARAPVGGVARVEQDEPRVVYRRVRIFETVDIDALKRCARDMPPKVDRARRGQFPAPPDMVVEEQPEPQQPARPQPVATIGRAQV